MNHIITSYRLQLVKESSKKYKADNIMNSSDNVRHVAEEILQIHKNAEEVMCILALDTKLKLIGTFEVSRGVIDQTLMNPREVFKRLLLLNSAKFIVIHNHPSQECTPSFADMECSRTLEEAGKLLGIKMIDFCISVDGDFYSFSQKGDLG